MTEVSILENLVNQVPSAVAVIAVVVLFLRSLEKRDQMFYDQMSKITERLNSMENILIKHDAKMDEAVKTIDKVANKKKAVSRKVS